jgi:hypothetical protein
VGGVGWVVYRGMRAAPRLTRQLLAILQSPKAVQHWAARATSMHGAGPNTSHLQYRGPGHAAAAKKVSAVGISNLMGLQRMEDIIVTPFQEIKQRTEELLRELNVQRSSYPDCLPQRGVYCSRTLNLRSIQAVGYDMVRLAGPGVRGLC